MKGSRDNRMKVDFVSIKHPRKHGSLNCRRSKAIKSQYDSSLSKVLGSVPHLVESPVRADDGDYRQVNSEYDVEDKVKHYMCEAAHAKRYKHQDEVHDSRLCEMGKRDRMSGLSTRLPEKSPELRGIISAEQDTKQMLRPTTFYGRIETSNNQSIGAEHAGLHNTQTSPHTKLDPWHPIIQQSVFAFL